MTKFNRRTYFILILIILDVVATFAFFTILNKYFYYTPLLGGLLGILIANVLKTPEEQPNQLKPKYDKLSIVLLFLFLIFTIFLLANFAINLFNIMSTPGLIFVLVFFDFMIIASFAAYQADRNSQWKKDHPN